MIEKEFNDRIYTKSTAKREKYTIFMLQNIGLFPLLDSLWGIERSGFFNDRGKWAKGFDNQRV